MNMNFRLQGGPRQGPLARVLALLGAALALVLAFTFSLVFLAVVAVAGLLVWGYVWWKTRELRRQLRAAGIDGRNGFSGLGGLGGADGFTGGTGPRDGAQDSAARGEIIEGEAVRVVDERQRIGGE